MNLFGLNISVSRSAPPPQTKACSPAAAAWLAGLDAPSGPLLSNSYEQVVWVYRAINALAEQVANIPFLLSRGERGRESLITSGPLLDFYNHPNPYLNRFQYWELRILWLMLRGECMRVPIYSDNLNPDLNPNLNPDPSRITHHASFCSQLKTKNSKLKTVLILDPACFQHIVENHQIIGWRYTTCNLQAPLDSQVLLPEEVWFERLPNPCDHWRGLSPLAVADVPVRSDFAAASFMRGLIENNAENGLIVRTDQQLSDDQSEQIRAALRQRKRRAGAADHSVLLWGVNEIVQPQLTSADLQFLENRKFTRAEICAAFGVPEEIVTTSDHNKYDVMQGARLNFIENRVAPLCARLEAEEDRTVKAIDPAAVGWFDLDSLPIMQQARRNRLAAAKTGFDMGIPFNELNRVLDLGFKPLPWGDKGYLPRNLSEIPPSQLSPPARIAIPTGTAGILPASSAATCPADPVATPVSPEITQRRLKLLREISAMLGSITQDRSAGVSPAGSARVPPAVT